MKKLIIANWKSHKTLAEVAYWLNNFPSNEEDKRALAHLEIILAPPYPFLSLAKEIIDERHLPIRLAVQDLSAFGSGAFTGEVAAFNLQGLDVGYAILGHSERRRLLSEGSQLVADKVAEAIKWQIKPILCLDKPYFSEQARFLSSDVATACALAYEPVAAIGSGLIEDAGNLLMIRKELEPIYASRTLIYGGSVNADNVASFLKVCDGVLVGTASPDLKDFVDLLFAASEQI